MAKFPAIGSSKDPECRRFWIRGAGSPVCGRRQVQGWSAASSSRGHAARNADGDARGGPSRARGWRHVTKREDKGRWPGVALHAEGGSLARGSRDGEEEDDDPTHLPSDHLNLNRASGSPAPRPRSRATIMGCWSTPTRRRAPSAFRVRHQSRRPAQACRGAEPELTRTVPRGPRGPRLLPIATER